MMKRLYPLFLVTIVALSSCGDDLENLTTVTEDVTLTQTFNVSVDQAQIPYTGSITFDATQDDQFARFGNKIDDVTVTSVSYTILDNSNYENNDDAVIENATFDFKKSDNSPINVASISDQNIAAILGVTSAMQFDQSALNDIATEIKDNQSVSSAVTVELDNPVAFDLELTIEMLVSGSIVN